MEKSLLELLEETYTELAIQETKFTSLKSKLEQILEMYYMQNPKEYIDDLSCANIFRTILSGKEVKNSDVNFKASKELTNFILVRCKKRGIKSITFDYVNSAAPKTKNLTANKFADGLSSDFFEPDKCYFVFSDKKYVWHWAQEINELDGIKFNNKIKLLCPLKEK